MNHSIYGNVRLVIFEVRGVGRIGGASKARRYVGLLFRVLFASLMAIGTMLFVNWYHFL